MKARLARIAQREIAEAGRWITKDSPTAARRFREEISRLGRDIAEYPLSGAERLELLPKPLRFRTLSGFPYVIVYDASAKPPVILRVVHGARNLSRVLSPLFKS